MVRVRADAVDWREVDGQVVVLDRTGSVYLAVNGSGVMLWPAVIEGATRADLVKILLDAYDVDPSRATADVDAFVGSLSERNLLER